MIGTPEIIPDINTLSVQATPVSVMAKTLRLKVSPMVMRDKMSADKTSQ